MAAKKLKWTSSAEVGELFHATGERVRHIIIESWETALPVVYLWEAVPDDGNVPEIIWHRHMQSVDDAKTLAQKMEEGHKPGPLPEHRSTGSELFKPEIVA